LIGEQAGELGLGHPPFFGFFIQSAAQVIICEEAQRAERAARKICCAKPGKNLA
jgi:hypothetical protein